MSEWPTNQEHYPPRSFNNSNNYRGPRRDANTAGGPGSRPAYQGNGGGFGGPRQNGYGQNGGGGGGGGGYGQSYDRPNFGQNRPPRTNFNGAPRNGNGGGSFQVVGGQSSVIEIDPSKVGMVIGRGGGKIREIQQNFQVHVKIDRDPGVNGLTGVTIRGEDFAIEQAKNFIEDLVAVK